MKALPFYHLIVLILAVVVSACVPKATEKKAMCKSTEAFNSVTRSCESVVEPRYIPVATKSSDSLTQETAKTITLTYTDANSNQATSCKISGQSSNIEPVSPQLISGNVFAKADLFFYAAQDTASALPIAARAAALLERDAMAEALAIARSSFNYSIITNQLGLFRAAALNILTAASTYTGTSSTISFYYELTQLKMADYDAAKSFVDNRCDCSGGVCTTVIAPKLHKSGAASFNYTITDMDGTSSQRPVSLTISALSSSNAFFKPAVESTYASDIESDTNIPRNYNFSLGTAKDYVGTTSFTYSHGKTLATAYFPTLSETLTYVNSDTGLGKITKCLGLGGSSSSDINCIYVPNDGDAYNALVPAKATVTFNTDLTITAKARGNYGNNISVVFKDITTDLTGIDSLSSAGEKFGLVGTTDDVYVRVSGDTIYVVLHDNVTTTEEVANAINADYKASRLVDASAAASTTKALVSSASAGIALSGGVAGYDTFTYTVSNGVASSTNTAKASIHISSTLDNPMWKPYPSTSSPLMAIDETSTSHLEGSALLSMSINLSTALYDPDDQATDCVVSTDPVDLALWSSGSNGLSGVTVAEVNKAGLDFAQVGPLPTCTISGVAPNKVITFDIDRTDAIKQNAFGTYALLFKVTNVGATLSTSLPTFQAYKFTITPINDPPAATAISWSTSSTNPVTSGSGAVWNMTTRENSSSSPSIAQADITVNPDATNTGFETSQTVTMTAVSDNQTLLKDSNISVTSVSGTLKRINFTTEQNQSGSANITVTLQDNGGTSNGGDDTEVYTIALTVTAVNDPPSLIGNITTIDTNEGGLVQSDGLTIEEDLGKSTDENDQEIKITNITSDNTAVLPTSGISVFYDSNDNGVEDSGEARALNADFDPGNEDVGLHKFYFKLKPVAGVSGNANVTVTYSDYTNTINSNFSLIVHPVAALHGGWSNISAVGVKSDKGGAPVSTNDIKCNYNKSVDTTSCDSHQNCTGSLAPHGSVVPDAVNTIYWDSANKRCYRSQSTSKFSWVDMTTTCPVTRIYVTSTTLSSAIASNLTASIPVASTAGYPAAGTITIGSEQITYTSKTATTFVGLTRGVNSTTAAAHSNGDVITYTANGTNFIEDLAATPSQTQPIVTATGQYYLDTADGKCYESSETGGVYSWNTSEYVPSKITLNWNAFTVTGSGPDSSVQVYGWNVYRREKGKDYDFKAGFLKKNSSDTMSISDATTRTYTDTTAVAGKVYYYLVRPVDSTTRHLTISTPEIFSEVRVLAPVANYVFVHRWMMNQEVCNSMHMTTSTTDKVDPTRNYRCPYKGPGEGASAGYYDIGKDLLVDISESGCPYTLAPECTANGCIDIGDPTSLGLTATAGSVYYDRSAGSCYVINGGGAWLDANSGAGAALMAAKKIGSALNPPLVNISKANAEVICNARPTTSAVTNLGIAKGATADPVTTHSLPSKKEYIAYSAAPFGMTDSLITDMEQGFSLNVQSRCNSSSANGIDSAFNDSPIPSTSYIYSLPGTASSGIRSIYTGSVPWSNNYSTEACSSRYGVQDVYGNVAEWMKDSMTCNTLQSTTLTGAINNAVGTIPVASTTGFPSPAGTIIIDSEQITYTGVTATSFTGATRGANATVAASHTSTTAVLTANNNNYVCKTVTGTTATSTDLGRYNFATGLYNDAATTQYAFDLLSGPYNDVNASSTANIGDGFLTEWDFRDELFGAGKFNFPMGMPINVDIASTALSTSPVIPYLLDIGPTAGITTSQLHEDGIIVNGAVINDITTNPTQTGTFAQGGSYLSGTQAGRYSSELVPDADVRPDIGFRCYIPIDPSNFPADAGRHTYSY